MMGLHRADLALIGTAATASGVSPAIQRASAAVDGSTAAGAAVRFLETEVVRFSWESGAAYLTPTDLIAVVSAAVLLIRFFAWAVAPLFKLLRGNHDRT